MNIKAFKKLIKEAVIDAIHEELPYILEEHMAKQDKKALRESRTMNFTSTDIQPTTSAVRSQLAEKMGTMFGMSPQPQYQSSVPLEVIRDQVNDETGEPVNPYLAFLVDSAQNMTPQEKAGLKNLG
jgi:microcompartment protein CcmL/EutN